MSAVDEIIESNIKCCINCSYFIVTDNKRAKCVCRLTPFYNKPILVIKLANRINNYNKAERKASGRLNCKFFI